MTRGGVLDEELETIVIRRGRQDVGSGREGGGGVVIVLGDDREGDLG